jgi:hypothetical protein
LRPAVEANRELPRNERAKNRRAALNGTQAFTALLRVHVPISSTTAAVGARYEVQLVVDGQQYGWYVRRLRGKYPQFDQMMATSRGPSGTGLSAGPHSYTVQARLLDAGTMTLNGTWSAAFGFAERDGVGDGLIEGGRQLELGTV